MPRKKVIADAIREQVVAIVDQFNEENASSAYVPRFRGAYLYLDRMDYGGRPSPICRLKWQGATDSWEFAIYKYSNNNYDPDEWIFPGFDEADGTITGAMRAGNEAHPV